MLVCCCPSLPVSRVKTQGLSPHHRASLCALPLHKCRVKCCLIQSEAPPTWSCWLQLLPQTMVVVERVQERRRVQASHAIICVAPASLLSAESTAVTFDSKSCLALAMVQTPLQSWPLPSQTKRESPARIFRLTSGHPSGLTAPITDSSSSCVS